MNLLLIDDHTLVRECMNPVLSRLDDTVVITEAADAMDALRYSRSNFFFDLVIMDFVLPDGGGINLINEILLHQPKAKVIVISMLEDPMVIEEALMAGAHGFIPKTTSIDVMLQAIQLVLSGDIYVPSALVNNSRIKNSYTMAESRLTLTKRQQEILEFLSKGKTNKEIGITLNISENTVRTHMTAIYHVLKVANRTEAGHVATKLGLISLS